MTMTEEKWTAHMHLKAEELTIPCVSSLHGENANQFQGWIVEAHTHFAVEEQLFTNKEKRLKKSQQL